MCKNISLYKTKNNNNKNINNILKQYYIVCSSTKECSDELVIKITRIWDSVNIKKKTIAQ